MKEEEQGSSPTLPAEIIEEILSRLPVKSLMRFRCVSKQWRSLFINPPFITKHLNRSTQKNPTHMLVTVGGRIYISEIESCTQVREPHYFFKEPQSSGFHVAASCDGLVCLSRFVSSVYQDLRLYNPATRESLLLPDDCSFSNSHPILGLGFDPKNKEYKVVKITTFIDQYYQKKTFVKMYTLGSHRWRTIPHSLPYIIFRQSQNVSVAVSGAVHWLAVHQVRNVSYGYESTRLISFDFQREVFQEVPLPEFQPKKSIFDLCIGVLGGCLSVSTMFIVESADLWVMKEYGVEESWTKLFSISSLGKYFYRLILPLVFWKDGEILLWKDGSHELILYNPESKTEMKPGFRHLPCLLPWASHMESLVRLRVGIGGATKKLEMEKREEAKV